MLIGFLRFWVWIAALLFIYLAAKGVPELDPYVYDARLFFLGGIIGACIWDCLLAELGEVRRLTKRVESLERILDEEP